MSAVVFLCGGTGNQLFQFTSSHPGDRFSPLFLRGPLARMLGWSEHERVLDFPAPPRWREWASLALLLADAALARIVGRSLFTRFDLRALKAEPLCARLQQFGYFQTCAPVREADELGRQLLAKQPAGGDEIDIAVHVRGGDVLRLEAEGRNPYGVLAPAYFATALSRHGGAGRRLTVFTDDPGHAAALLAEAAPGVPAWIDDGPLAEMLAQCIAARTFIACNSTLSWWIVRLRGSARESVAPEPFARELPLANPEYVHAIPVRY